jgi:UDP-glucose:(heptosyl)LPS alpha-1,3-glucosyltransferase
MLRVVPGRLLPGSRERPAARRYIALSRRIRDDMVRLWGAPPEAIAVCPNGVDVARFTPPDAARRAAARAEVGARDGDLVVGFVSNHFALRGLEPLVRALALEGGPSLLLVGGRGKQRGPERLARELDVPVRFLGELADVRPLLAASDVFALPTFYDACSLATLEALAVGLPVVTSRANGAAELFSGREGAVLERAGDMGAIAGALRRLRDPARRAACGAAARETALANPLERALGRVVDAVEEAAR